MKLVSDPEIAAAVIAYEGVSCVLGKEGELTPQPAVLTSCTGGAFWGVTGETWPSSSDGKPLIPWLQIVCAEFGALGFPFRENEVICFFIDKRAEYEEISQPDAAPFVVREYKSAGLLQPLPVPEDVARYGFRPVSWRETMDYPAISKYGELFEAPIYDALVEEKEWAYKNHSGIKIGGWPTPIQQSQEYPGTWDLQIDMTRNYVYGDSGIGYLSKLDGGWYLRFETC